MIRKTCLFCIATSMILATAEVRAADLLWQPAPTVSTNLWGASPATPDANYFNNTTSTANVAPSSSDILFIGINGNVTQSSGPISFQKLRIGHVTGASTYQGAGTVTINNGAQINLTGTGTGVDASLIISEGAVNTSTSGPNGTLNIDGAGTTVTAAQQVQIGFGSRTANNANLNITNGASLVVTTDDINLGQRNAVSPGASGSGVPGHLTITGATSTLTALNGDLNVGVRAGSSYSQTDATVSISGAIDVGNNSANASSFSMKNGTLTAKSLTIGDTANNVTGLINGTAVVSLTTNNLNVGLNASQNASLTVADTANIDIPNTASSTGNVFLGRGTSQNAKFTMTGGSIHTGRNFLLGTATASTPTVPSVGATGIVGTQSGGSITTNLNFTIGDTNGDSTYNLSGGSITANDTVVVGRQTESSKAGVLNQTGGTVTAAKGITIGDAQQTTINTLVWGRGTYNVSGGVINANQAAGGTALRIAPQGLEGTFRVIGQDADINVNGNMTVNSGTTPATTVGTLAYRLEPGESLSEIDVTGTATFAAGAILNLDTSLASPTQTSYDVLIAGSIVDNGISFSGPSGWGYRIVDAPLPGDHNIDRSVDLADYVTWRSNSGTDPGYADFRQNFGTTGRKVLQVYQLPGPGSGLESGAVPEPASLLLVLCALLGLTSVRRR